jgi:DNA-binding CsgD family transcriptional regulator
MARLSALEKRRLGEVATEINTLRTHDPCAAARTLEAVQEIVATEQMLLCLVSVERASVRIERAVMAADGHRDRAEKFVTLFNAQPATDRRSSLPWDPFDTPTFQRNRVVSRSMMRSMTGADPFTTPAAGMLKSALERHDGDTVRLTLCDGPRTIGAVLGVQGSLASATQRARMMALAKVFHQRLLFEQRVDASTWALPALEHLLDGLGGAGYVVATNGAVVHANEVGRTALDRTDDERTEVARAALDGAHPGFDVLDLPPCEGARYLVLARKAPVDASARAASWAGRLALTPQEARVLALLAQGETNKGIAVALDISVRTAECHVASIMRRLGATTRADLVARIYADVRA